MGVFHRREIQQSRKTRTCFWCGEEIESGQPYTVWRWRIGSRAAITIHVHPECGDAWDNASFHRAEGAEYVTPPGEHERGKYRCPYAYRDEGRDSCHICENTPFRRLKRGDEKPALTHFDYDNMFARRASEKLMTWEM